MNTAEIWRPIVGYEASYEVSDLGRVRSVDRIDASGHRRRGRVLAQAFDSDRYRVVGLCLRGKMRQFKVHRLVAVAFLGDRPGCFQVNHLDGDKSNNTVANLEWTTCEQNHAHAARIGLKAKGEESGSARLTREQVLRIAEMRRDGARLGEIVVALGLGRSATAHVYYGHVWAHTTGIGK